MATARLRQFDRQLHYEVVPVLSGHGFVLGDERTFRRGVEHEDTRSTQIIEFQIGRKVGFFGRFTVNLAVHNRDHLPAGRPVPETEPHSWDCQSDLVQRLGFFRAPRRGFWDRLLGRPAVAEDHWWVQSDDPQLMRRELAEVMDLLLSHGLTWLRTRTSLVAFSWALRQLQRRKEWKAALGSPSCHSFWSLSEVRPVWDPEPFPGEDPPPGS